jgi:hypothetical protein|tara:strand:- start:3645 stop:4595 length:951 start_codon:yes stop_codon:yes gene_type:complete
MKYLARWFSLGVFSLTACEMDSVSLMTPESLLIAQVYIAKEGAKPLEATAYLHRVLGSKDYGPVLGADITLTSGDRSVILVKDPDRTSTCIPEWVQRETSDISGSLGTCYRLQELLSAVPGEAIQVSIKDGGVSALFGQTTLPGDFTMKTPRNSRKFCTVQRDQILELSWSESQDAWAYVVEANVWDLDDVYNYLPEEDRPPQPLNLVGLSISSDDTKMRFPSEVGLFDRYGLHRDVFLQLQVGLPESTTADISVAAVDRNFVNWARAGKFHPSGQIRTPSLLGKSGTGVIASYLRKNFKVLADSTLQGLIGSCTS